MSNQRAGDDGVDPNEWGDPIPVKVRRAVTLSVRFSDEEITAVRQAAEAAGMKVTAYIRQTALSGAGQGVDRDKVARALAAAAADVQRARDLVQGAA